MSLLPNYVKKSLVLPNGKTIELETGKLAKQADASVVLKYGDLMLLATVVSSHTAKEGVDFLPLSVDYQEKFASAGRIPGGFLKREGRISDYEILISRLIDRAIRPLFPDDYHADTQVMVYMISASKEQLPDSFAALAVSAALSISDIPFNGPISEVRVGRVNGQFIVNPTNAEVALSDLDFIVAASEDNVLMVEGESSEISETELADAIYFAHQAIKEQVKFQKEFANGIAKAKREYNHETNDLELKAKLSSLLYDRVYEACKIGSTNKQVRNDAIYAIQDEYIAALPDDSTENKGLIKKYFHDIHKEASRNLVLNESIRLDGRKLNEIRPIWSEVDYLPSAHGSAIFTRGETQSLTTVTIGTKLDEQMFDSAAGLSYSKFLLHYNFPGFSTGEVKPNRGPGRREIGHGNLALRALKKVLPAEGVFPYTIRIVSDILESNGSSSMATVCAGSLALHDAGVPIKSHVSGIAMGLIAKDGKFAVLSDILGDEDHLGDMDFKVTGTDKGITAVQMDLKIEGLPHDVLLKALHQANEGRLHILNKLKETITTPREELKPNAPRMVALTIEKEFIGAVIGPGGKIIQEMQKSTGATIVIEEIDNKGIVSIFATEKNSLDQAVARVKAIVAIPEIGEVYDGKVKTIQPYGAFVEFMPGKDGLLHISEIKWEKLETMDGILQEGEVIKVKLLEVDKKTGKYKLSRKVLLPKPEQV